MTVPAALEAKVRQVFEQMIPFNRVLGLKVVSSDPAQLRFDMRPELIGNPAREILHGGVISSVLDVAGGYSIFLAVLAQDPNAGEDVFKNLGTVDLRVDYLRPGRGKHFVATSKVVRLGNRIAVAHMELHNDTAELIATGSAAYVVG